MTPVTVSAEPGLDAELIERLCSGIRDASLWRDIAERGLRVTRWLQLETEPQCAFSEAGVERLSVRLERYIRENAPALQPQATLAALRQVARSFEPHEQQRLCTLLERGSDPLRALADLDPSWLFSAEELSLLAQLKLAHGKSLRQLPMRWQRGQDMQYGSYVCAIVKLTRQCNLRCTYCIDWRSGPETRMPFPVLAHAISKLMRAHGIVDFICHGGEPTLLTRRDYLRLLAVQQYFRAGHHVLNQLQTNGTLIDREWADFFADFGFDVNVSLDGPPEIQAQSRPLANGRSSYDAARRGIRLLRERGLAQGVLIVVGESMVQFGADALLRFLQDEQLLDVGVLALRPGNPPHPGRPYLTLPRYMQFLIELERARRARPEPWVRIREIDAVAEVLGGANPRFCELLGNCVGSYFTIEADGSVGHCDKFLGDPRYTLGNIVDSDLASLRSAAPSCGLREREHEDTTRLSTCPHFAVCRGWCPHERYVSKGMNLGVAPSCCGLAPLIEELAQPK